MTEQVKTPTSLSGPAGCYPVLLQQQRGEMDGMDVHVEHHLNLMFVITVPIRLFYISKSSIFVQVSFYSLG